jgi:hypothetical protein
MRCRNQDWASCTCWWSHSSRCPVPFNHEMQPVFFFFSRVRPSRLSRIRINFRNYGSFWSFWQDSLDGGSAHSNASHRRAQHTHTHTHKMRTYECESKNFRTESVTKCMLTTINTRWEETQMDMVAKLFRLTHKLVVQLHLVARNCTICSSRSRRPVRKLWIHLLMNWD